jgi:hypothetical protein
VPKSEFTLLAFPSRLCWVILIAILLNASGCCIPPPPGVNGGTNDGGQAQPAEPSANSLRPGPTFDDVDAVMDSRRDSSKRLTEAQRDAYWQSVEGTLVTWSGEVGEVSIDGSGSLRLRCNPANDGPDTQVDLDGSQLADLAGVQKGQIVTVEATLKRHSVAGYTLENGKGVRTPQTEKQEVAWYRRSAKVKAEQQAKQLASEMQYRQQAANQEQKSATNRQIESNVGFTIQGWKSDLMGCRVSYRISNSNRFPVTVSLYPNATLTNGEWRGTSGWLNPPDQIRIPASSYGDGSSYLNLEAREALSVDRATIHIVSVHP